MAAASEARAGIEGGIATVLEALLAAHRVGPEADHRAELLSAGDGLIVAEAAHGREVRGLGGIEAGVVAGFHVLLRAGDDLVEAGPPSAPFQDAEDPHQLPGLGAPVGKGALDDRLIGAREALIHEGGAGVCGSVVAPAARQTESEHERSCKQGRSSAHNFPYTVK